MNQQTRSCAPYHQDCVQKGVPLCKVATLKKIVAKAILKKMSRLFILCSPLVELTVSDDDRVENLSVRRALLEGLQLLGVRDDVGSKQESRGKLYPTSTPNTHSSENSRQQQQWRREGKPNPGRKTECDWNLGDCGLKAFTQQAGGSPRLRHRKGKPTHRKTCWNEEQLCVAESLLQP